MSAIRTSSFIFHKPLQRRTNTLEMKTLVLFVYLRDNMAVNHIIAGLLFDKLGHRVDNIPDRPRYRRCDSSDPHRTSEHLQTSEIKTAPNCSVERKTSMNLLSPKRLFNQQDLRVKK